MENQLLQAPTLLAARQLYSNNSRIAVAIDTALNEEEAYAADELVVLAEEVLHQIAAVGFAHYIKHAPQKEVYNDFLVELFNSTGHSYNAGPLYRWAANMVKECPRMRSSGLRNLGRRRDGWQSRDWLRLGSLGKLKEKCRQFSCGSYPQLFPDRQRRRLPFAAKVYRPRLGQRPRPRASRRSCRCRVYRWASQNPCSFRDG